jgi:hypothetical protein
MVIYHIALAILDIVMRYGIMTLEMTTIDMVVLDIVMGYIVTLFSTPPLPCPWNMVTLAACCCNTH